MWIWINIILSDKFELRKCYNVVRVNLIVTVGILGKHARAQHKQKRISKTKNKTKEEKYKKKLNQNQNQTKSLVSVQRVSTVYLD